MSSPDVDRWIVASSGGFVGTGLWGVMRPGRIFTRALELSGRPRPRVLLVLTASGDDPQYLAAMYSALADTDCDV
ncbi:MAG: peptidase E, partial [Actinomycetia bacterium]|nr:peptidase E [Actinomycetes bacterium]